jgi:hypothetical protein
VAQGVGPEFKPQYEKKKKKKIQTLTTMNKEQEQERITDLEGIWKVSWRRHD